MSDLTPERLDEIRARLDAATPGSWTVECSDDLNVYVMAGFNAINVGYVGNRPETNAVLIAHAPADIAALLTEVDRLTALVNAEDNVTDGLADALEYTSQALAKVTDERDRLAVEVAELRANPRDDYHTMRELYEYRMLYNAHAVKGWVAAGVPVVKSWRHSDGELCFGGGWFIVSADLPTGQVSNHYKANAWGMFACPEVETAPAWDGHTPAEAADRLKFALDGES